jgi:hypothetical protein
MGYFSIASKRDSDPTPLESRVLIADKDIDRITVAYAQLYFPNGVQEGGDPTADPPIPPDVRPPTGQEVFDAVANGLLQGILANTINQEKANAAKHAQDDVPPIPVEPGA